LAAQQTYWLSWASPVRIDPTSMTVHKMDKSEESSYVYLRTKYLQVCRSLASALIVGP
jgi:hypothetical protein